jgi:hypothetical protein
MNYIPRPQSIQYSAYGKVCVVGALATELVECALKATIPLIMEWQPYKTVVATILHREDLPHVAASSIWLPYVADRVGNVVVGFS